MSHAGPPSKRRRWRRPLLIAVAAFVAIIALGATFGGQGSPSKTAAAAVSPTPAPASVATSTVAATPAAKTRAAANAPRSSTRSALSPTTVARTPDVAPAALTCSSVGGVFVAHGTDGRGDCEPANPDPQCHDTNRVGTDGNYVDAIILDPPTADGVIADPETLQFGVSDPECWKGIPRASQ